MSYDKWATAMQGRNKEKSQMPTVLTTGDVAERLGLSTSRVVQLARSGVIVCEQTRNGRIFRVDDVERLAAARSNESQRLSGSGSGGFAPGWVPLCDRFPMEALELE